jgi:hypothetical protein
MRIVLLAGVAALALVAFGRLETSAAEFVPPSPGLTASSQAREIDDNDDTRVEVQLVVLAVAVGTVFVLGSGVYLLRKRLGLVAPPPDQDPGSHH